jgi:YHS domain-containing protein
MNFLSRIVQFLFWVIVVTWGLRLLRWFFSGSLRQGQSQAGSANTTEPDGTPGANRRLVRDPVCGMHVAEVLAIPLREGLEVVHFCSTHCRDEYVTGTRKFAANG